MSLCDTCKKIQPDCYGVGMNFDSINNIITACSDYKTTIPVTKWEVKISNTNCPYHPPSTYVKDWTKVCIIVGECEYDECPYKV